MSSSIEKRIAAFEERLEISETRIRNLKETVNSLTIELAATKKLLNDLSKKTPDANALALSIRNDVNSVVATTISEKIEPKLKHIDRRLYELGTDDTMVSEYRSRVMAQGAVEDHRRGNTGHASQSHNFLAFRDGGF